MVSRSPPQISHLSSEALVLARTLQPLALQALVVPALVYLTGGNSCHQWQLAAGQNSLDYSRRYLADFGLVELFPHLLAATRPAEPEQPASK